MMTYLILKHSIINQGDFIFSLMQRSYDYVFKVCLLGQSSVGKTALLRRYADDEFDESTLATIGVDFRFKSLNIKGNYVKLQLWDTTGQERFRSVVESYYRDADAIILVYDGLNLQSFQMIEEYWLNEVKKNTKPECLIYLFANKMQERIRIGREERDWCDRNRIRCFQMSAKTGWGVSSSIDEVVTKLTEVRPRLETEKLVMTLNEYSPPRQKGCCS